MKPLLILILALLFSFENTNSLNAKSKTVSSMSPAAEISQEHLYEGTLNGTIPISLFLVEQEHPCGGDAKIFYAMYKYDRQEKWLLLSITMDQHYQHFCMVEDPFTGVLILSKNDNELNGIWSSPDHSKQYDVALKKVALEVEMNAQLQEILFDDLLYNKNDC